MPGTLLKFRSKANIYDQKLPKLSTFSLQSDLRNVSSTDSTFASCFFQIFFTSLCVTALLYRQALNWFIGIIRTNSTALLWINIIAIVHLRQQISKITQPLLKPISGTKIVTTAYRYSCWNAKPKIFNQCFI